MAASLREVRHDVPMVVASGHSETEVWRRFGDSIDGFLPKPYTISDLARVVDTALKKRSEA